MVVETVTTGRLPQKYIFKEIFLSIPPTTPLQQIAVFINHPKGRDKIAGGAIVSIDELMAEIRAKIVACGIMSKNAIPEQYLLLRTLQLSHVGYYRTIVPGSKVIAAVSSIRM
jgi:hypothetical protein